MRATPSTSPLVALAIDDQRQRGCLHHNTTGGHRHAMGLLLVHHVHHVGLAAGIKVGQFAHTRKAIGRARQGSNQASGGARPETCDRREVS